MIMNAEFSCEEGQEALRKLQYSIPDEVNERINFVQPTNMFGSLKPLIPLVQIIDEGKKSNGMIKRWGPSSPLVSITPQGTADL
jgi:hypothetical protein